MNGRPGIPGRLFSLENPTALRTVSMESRPLLALTMGDPAGIGPEVIAKAFQKLPHSLNAIVIGDAAWMRRATQRYASDISVRALTQPQEATFDPLIMNVLDLQNVPDTLPPGRASAEGGKASVEYIRKAVDLTLDNTFDGICTAPISKEAIHMAGHTYPGHTEMLADFTGTQDVALMLAGSGLRVVLTTTHVAVQDVIPLITRERVSKTLQLTHQSLIQFGIENPRIAVTGLNPHCGDGGIFGNEEQTIIAPAIASAKQAGMDISGPFSADALFGRIHHDPYDAVVTMYHDQGMIPVKMASMGHAVNITLGLPILRTSVDHGTAYDIVGQGNASEDSLLQALAMAAALSKPAATHS